MNSGEKSLDPSVCPVRKTSFYYECSNGFLNATVDNSFTSFVALVRVVAYSSSIFVKSVAVFINEANCGTSGKR